MGYNIEEEMEFMGFLSMAPEGCKSAELLLRSEGDERFLSAALLPSLPAASARPGEKAGVDISASPAQLWLTNSVISGQLGRRKADEVAPEQSIN